MCLAKAFLKYDDNNKLILADVASIERRGDKLILTTLFQETEELELNIKTIDFVNSSIILESEG